MERLIKTKLLTTTIKSGGKPTFLTWRLRSGAFEFR